MCRENLKLAKELVTKWLGDYMFKGQRDSRKKAGVAAASLASHQMFKTHGRHINRDLARSFHLVIDDLEADKTLEDLVMSVFHATTLTFDSTNAAKIVENHLGHAFVKQISIVIAARRPPQPGAEGAPPATTAPSSPPPGDRPRPAQGSNTLFLTSSR